jgi:hypothetical protein
MSRSYSKIRHIQEANKNLESRIISEKNMSTFFKTVIREAFLPDVQEGDDLCDILCFRKQANYGSNGEVVKLIQNALANCGFNPDHQGGGMTQGCKEDHTKCDGKFREETKKATEGFQKENNLTVDGSVGAETLKKLQEKGCIKLPDCQCDEKDTDNTQDDNTKTDNQEWWKLIGKDDPKFGDCKKINSCLYKTLKKSTTFNWVDFVKCMEGVDYKIDDKTDCGKCPDSYNMMPIIGAKPSVDMEFIKACITKGCTKGIY